jgi:hypothetical protein
MSVVVVYFFAAASDLPRGGGFNLRWASTACVLRIRFDFANAPKRRWSGWQFSRKPFDINLRF